jgi:predicted porin
MREKLVLNATKVATTATQEIFLKKFMEIHMKTKLSLAVAAALLAGASSAQAGIMIPAGDWTLDIGGIVNAYYTSTRQSGDFNGLNGAVLGGSNTANVGTSSNITTGLLPNYLSVSGKTRQNDLDVGFTISINPGASRTQSGNQGAQQENRQAFLTFGDKAWGSIKLGKDLGIYASDAILNDMTLLGVGSGAGILAGNTTTLGRIGTGFQYADWKSQVAYSSPNWNGFSFTAGLTQSWNTFGATLNDAAKTSAFNSFVSAGRGGASPAFEGKASYEWAGDFGGKVWASGITQRVNGAQDRAEAFDIGATVNVAGFGLTGYYGQGSGMGTTVQLRDGFDTTGTARDSDDWYVQGTYTIPGVGTKIGLSYGESSLDGNGVADTGLASSTYSNRMWTIGAYHPITKHLNLVAEYDDVKTEIGNASGTSRTIGLGAIMFF